MTAKDLFGALVRLSGFLGFAIGLLLVIREVVSLWLGGAHFTFSDTAYFMEPGLSAMIVGLAIMVCARGIAFLAYGRDPNSN